MINDKCPRREGMPVYPGMPDTDHWRQPDNTCSYCGSMNPDTLMARLKAGDVSCGPTDKPNKLYVNNKGGAQFKQTHKTPTGELQTQEVSHAKFYFQHLSEEQKREFVRMYNDSELHIGYPGHFYTLPYFMKLMEPTETL